MANPVFDKLLVVGILAWLGLMIYCRMTGKTLLDVIRELKEGFNPPTEEIT